MIQQMRPRASRFARPIAALWSVAGRFDAPVERGRTCAERLGHDGAPNRATFHSTRDFRSFTRIKARRSYRERSSGPPPTAEIHRACLTMKPRAHLFELMMACECQHRVADLPLPWASTRHILVCSSAEHGRAQALRATLDDSAAMSAGGDCDVITPSAESAYSTRV